MKRLLLASVAMAGFAAASGAASAADIPYRMATKAPVQAPAPYFSWTGCYVGAHLGGAGLRDTFTNTSNTTLWGDLAPGQGYSNESTGVFGGGQLGCNYQMGALVLGVEGTASGTGLGYSFTNTAFGAGDDVFETRLNWIGTVTGKLGFAWNNALLYAKGGYAGADVSFSASDSIPPIGSGSDRRWHDGWTVGGGLDYALTPNWIVGVEGNYYRFETLNHQVGGGAGAYNFDVAPRDVYAITGRVSYKFGWNRPVHARY